MGVVILALLLLAVCDVITPAPLACGPIRVVAHGTPSNSNSRAIGVKIRYECDEHYRHTGRRKANKCQRDGTWTNNVKCTYNSTEGCSAMARPRYTLIEGLPHVLNRRFPVGTVGKVICARSHVTKMPSDTTITCTNASRYQWTGSGMGLKCKLKSCGYPGTPEHGGKDSMKYTYRSVVQFHCHKGYRLQGAASTVCLINETWSERTPYCEEICCDQLNNTANGIVHTNGNCYGDKGTVQCDKGYLIEGRKSSLSATITCTDSGEWEPVMPVCVEALCPEIPHLSNGYPPLHYGGDGNRWTYGSAILFRCNEHTTTVGETHAICLDDGNWDIKPPICYGSCKELQLENGNNHGQSLSSLDYVAHGTATLQQCNNGWKLGPEDAQKSAICFNGTWITNAACIPDPSSNVQPSVGTTDLRSANIPYTTSIPQSDDSEGGSGDFGSSDFGSGDSSSGTYGSSR